MAMEVLVGALVAFALEVLAIALLVAPRASKRVAAAALRRLGAPLARRSGRQGSRRVRGPWKTLRPGGDVGVG